MFRVVRDKILGESRKERNYVLLEKVLATAKDVVGSWGGKLYLVYLPEEWNCIYNFKPIANLESCLDMLEARRRFIEIADRLGIALFDTGEAFLKEYRELHPNLPLHHPSALGYRYIADTVLLELEERLR